MSRVLRAYVRLLEWGEGNGVPHRGCDAPCEYAARLASVFPEKNGQLALVTEVLEEALFSTHLLPGMRMAAYFSAVREIKRREKPIQVRTAGTGAPRA